MHDRFSEERDPAPPADPRPFKIWAKDPWMPDHPSAWTLIGSHTSHEGACWVARSQAMFCFYDVKVLDSSGGLVCALWQLLPQLPDHPQGAGRYA